MYMVSGRIPGNSSATTEYRYAAPVPIETRVNMFSERFRSESHPRRKNGAAPQRTTGVASANWIHWDAAVGMRSSQADTMGKSMDSTMIGTARAAEIQNRRVMSASSGSGPVASVAFTGSRAIPHFGHVPGPSCRTSGCMGQVYSTPSEGVV